MNTLLFLPSLSLSPSLSPYTFPPSLATFLHVFPFPPLTLSLGGSYNHIPLSMYLFWYTRVGPVHQYRSVSARSSSSGALSPSPDSLGVCRGILFIAVPLTMAIKVIIHHAFSVVLGGRVLPLLLPSVLIFLFPLLRSLSFFILPFCPCFFFIS